jgi:hypothetical protein
VAEVEVEPGVRAKLHLRAQVRIRTLDLKRVLRRSGLTRLRWTNALSVRDTRLDREPLAEADGVGEAGARRPDQPLVAADVVVVLRADAPGELDAVS